MTSPPACQLNCCSGGQPGTMLHHAKAVARYHVGNVEQCALGGEVWQVLLIHPDQVGGGAAGALCCTKHGARLGIPTAAEVATLLAADA